MFSDLDICLNKIKKKNENEFQKKLKKYNLKDNRVVDDTNSYLINKYIRERDNKNYVNSIRLKSLRLEKTDKYYKGDEKDFFEKFNSQSQNVFKKKWTTLPINLKLIKVNEYINKNKIDDKLKNKILTLLQNKQLRKQVEYDMENGFIKNIKF